MPSCKNCDSAGRSNDLVRMPSEITQSAIFARRGVPFFLCKECDAQAYKAAMQTHKLRIEE